MNGDALYESIRTYSGFGYHQSATSADLETGHWLAGRLESAGLAVHQQPFRLQQFFVAEHDLTVNARSQPSYPLWWPVAGTCRGACVRIEDSGAMPDLSGKVALVEISTRGASMTARVGQSKVINAAIDKGAVGVLALTKHPSGEFVGMNAMDGLVPWRVPVMLVGTRVADQIQNGAPIEMVIKGSLQPDAEAFEVIGRYENGGDEYVISTPYSGWFTCAGERGPGVALWLGLAEWIGATKPRATFTLVASSGHELSGVGIRNFLEHTAPTPARLRSWLHLGAGIATYGYETKPWRKTDQLSTLRRVMTNDAALMPALERHLSRIELAAELTDEPGGEMIQMARKGYKVWGFAGGSAYHHLMDDVPERVTGPDILEQTGVAILDALKESIG